MWWILLIGFLGFGLLVGLSVYLACKKFFALDASHLLEQAKAKAQAIELEAQNLLHKKQLELKDMQLSLEQSYKRKGARTSNNIHAQAPRPRSQRAKSPR